MSNHYHGSVRCERIYPNLDTQKRLSDLKTFGLQLSPTAAINLAMKLIHGALTRKLVHIWVERYRARVVVGTSDRRVR